MILSRQDLESVVMNISPPYAAGKDYYALWRKLQGVFLCVCRKAGQLQAHKERISIINLIIKLNNKKDIY